MSKMTVKPISLDPAYNQEQQEAIKKALEDTKDTLNGFLSYEWSDQIVERGSQQFAIFGDIARELLSFDEVDDDKGRAEYVPIVVGGRMICRLPDEGQAGVAYLWRVIPDDGTVSEWWVCWPSLGWLWRRELDLASHEIEERIAEEIDQGATHITGGKPGW